MASRISGAAARSRPAARSAASSRPARSSRRASGSPRQSCWVTGHAAPRGARPAPARRRPPTPRCCAAPASGPPPAARPRPARRGSRTPSSRQPGLVDVRAGAGVDQAVEQHAGLQRGQRIDVLDRPAVADQPVHGRLVQPGQREVRRGTAAGARPRRSARRSRAARRSIRSASRAHRRLVVHLVGVQPGQLQLAVLDQAGHVQQVRAALVRRPGPARRRRAGRGPGRPSAAAASHWPW